MTAASSQSGIPSREALLSLADRCEAATGPDRGLDAVIAVAVGGYFTIPPKWEGGPLSYGYVNADGEEVHPGQGGDQLVKPYTASLDAAMTLVPQTEQEATDIQRLLRDGKWSAFAKVSCIDDRGWSYGDKAYAATPALALCAAALRARAAMEGK